MLRPAVLFVLNYLGQSSVTRRTLALIHELGNRYDFHVACIKKVEGREAQVFEQAGAKVIALPAERLSCFQVIPPLVRYIHANQVQIVHTQVLASDVIGGIAAKLAGQTLLFSTKPNMHYIAGQGLNLLRNIPYWLAMYLPDQIVAVSEIMRGEILAHVRLPPNRVATIRTGIDADSFDRPQMRDISREYLGLQPTDFVLAYAGRLVAGKGLECLIEAFRQTSSSDSSVHLIIIGDGPLGAHLRTLVSEAGLTHHVLFTGFRHDIPGLLAAADVFVLPSLTEGLPQSVMEAMAAGKAVIATSVGGVPELIESGVTGLLIPPGDQAALTGAILQLAKDPLLCEFLGRNARSVARHHFGFMPMTEHYNALYQMHLGRKRRR